MNEGMNIDMWQKEGRKEGSLVGWMKGFVSKQRECVGGYKGIFSL